jgi:uncharacterized protein
MTPRFRRPVTAVIQARLSEPVRHIIYVSGPRQVGKTTAIRQVLETFDQDSVRFLMVDSPDDDNNAPEWSTEISVNQNLIRSPARPYGAIKDTQWLIQVWKEARVSARDWLASPASIGELGTTAIGFKNQRAFTLVFDEIQKIEDWSSVVKGLWDQDRLEGLAMHVVLLGSAPLLMQRGLTESLTGRFEMIRITHWSYIEMRDCFNFSLDQYVFFGAYPGAAQQLLDFDEDRWLGFVLQSLIEPNVKKDVMALARIDKPALLLQLFNLACAYSGQLVSMNKLKGELDDAGNTTTLSHYLELLRETGLIAGLTKYSGQQLRQRSAPPKLNVLNTVFQSAALGKTFVQARADSSIWGHLVESSIGAHLINSASNSVKVHYWRDGNFEVDFVLKKGDQLVAIEVKSGAVKPSSRKGLQEFSQRNGGSPFVKTCLIGQGYIELEDALQRPADDWFDS